LAAGLFPLDTSGLLEDVDDEGRAVDEAPRKLRRWTEGFSPFFAPEFSFTSRSGLLNISICLYGGRGGLGRGLGMLDDASEFRAEMLVALELGP
jgi:hypothetical protein